jgi:hypothetical protein
MVWGFLSLLELRWDKQVGLLVALNWAFPDGGVTTETIGCFDDVSKLLGRN